MDGLHAGHKYSVAVHGLKEGKDELIKEETVSMEPIPPNFAPEDIHVGTQNITLITNKEAKAVQVKNGEKWLMAGDFVGFFPNRISSVGTRKEISRVGGAGYSRTKTIGSLFGKSESRERIRRQSDCCEEWKKKQSMDSNTYDKSENTKEFLTFPFLFRTSCCS